MIELKDTNQGSFYVINEDDVVGLVVIKHIKQWIAVTPECFFEVKALLKSRLK